MAANLIYMQSPQGDEVKEVEATAEKLSPLMAAGWNQVPAPAGHKPAIPAKEGK
jgi:hypothetical protein